MKAIVRKRQYRRLAEKEKPGLIFNVRGAEVDTRKIERWMNEHNVSEDKLYEPEPPSSM